MASPTQEKNEAPWPSFGHVGVWYAELSAHAMEQLSVPVTAIQRWWRLRKRLSPCNDSPIPISNIKMTAFHTNPTEFIAFNRKQAHLKREVAAYEKLDGTNLGVRCDGQVFGRRYRVIGDTYQRVKLRGAIPTGEQVAAIKLAISQHVLEYEDKAGIEHEVSITQPKLVLYGELMCNPTKFKYVERFENHPFFCFGAVLDSMSSDGTRISYESMDSIYNRLNHSGIVAEIVPKTGCIRISMNGALSSLVKSEGVKCAPLLESGALREVCFKMKELLLSDNMEGVVLTGKGCLFKWKASNEDESKGYTMLSKLLTKYSKEALEFAGVDASFIKLLMDVAKSEKKSRTDLLAEKRMARAKAKKARPQAPFNTDVLEKAWESAISKYDTLNTYFEKDEREVIRNDLKEEMLTEFNASKEEEIKCVEYFVNKAVGTAFGKWKRENGNMKCSADMCK